MLTIGSLFSGIGGLELGLERAGLGPVLWQVERDADARKVLEQHWPEAERYADVRQVGAATLARVDLICGGFPCQDISSAGVRLGLAGERSGLWFEYARIIRELRPRFVVVENVSALLARGMGDVLGALATLGYDAWWDCIPAAAVGAHHRRDRVFIVAYSDRYTGSTPNQPKPPCKAPRWRLADRLAGAVGTVWEREPDVGRVVDGFPGRLDRLRLLGNAVVPQCAEVVGHVIRQLAHPSAPRPAGADGGSR